MTDNFARGLNILTPVSGCFVAARVYQGASLRYQDCKSVYPRERLVGNSLSGLRANETLYMDVRRLSEFVDNALANLTVPIVLLSGMFEKKKFKAIDPQVQSALLNHPNITHWFLHNPTFYTEYTDSLPTKMSALPFGIQHIPYNPRISEKIPSEVFRQAMAAFEVLPNKSIDIFYGYLSTYTNPNRTNIPSGPKQSPTDYYESIAKSRFILSPAGDRPECYRHYEALGLGSIPITELPRDVYRHLEPGPALFHTTNWDLTADEAAGELLRNGTSSNYKYPFDPLQTNRNMVFEEYWLEYIDNIVGRELIWWDKVGQSWSTVNMFQLNYSNIPHLVRSLTEQWKDQVAMDLFSNLAT